jgi:imidazolonepropionase-like amidohydrolase
LFLYIASIQLNRQDVNTLCDYLDTAGIDYKEHVPSVIEELVKDDARLQRRQKVSLSAIVYQLPNFNYTNYLEFRNIVVDAKIPLVDGVKMVSTTPAKVMRVDDSMGSIEIGKKADLCLFDDQINICRTIVGGKVKEF